MLLNSPFISRVPCVVRASWLIGFSLLSITLLSTCGIDSWRSGESSSVVLQGWCVSLRFGRGRGGGAAAELHGPVVVKLCGTGGWGVGPLGGPCGPNSCLR